MIIKIKPLSVNKARQWKRFKTKDYKQYEKALLMLLPHKINIKDTKNMELHVKRGFSNSLSDVSNPIKLFEDILQKKYWINDRYFWREILEKEIVPKGEEYIYFDIKEYVK